MCEDDRLALDNNGWEIECESPFEICYTETGDRATGVAAQIILEVLRKEYDYAVKRLKRKNGN